MFDIGFWELALIGVILLLVVGPERLPKVARTAGLWVGRGRRMLSAMKEEINREIKAQELQEILDRQARRNPLETILDESGEKPTVNPSPIDSTSAPVGPGDRSESGSG